LIFIVLSILANVGNAVLLKTGEIKQHNRLAVMTFNYLVATILAALIWGWNGLSGPGAATFGFGLIGGVFYAGTMFAWMVSMARTGITISTAVLRMALVWPVAVSIVFFREIPNVFQALGIAASLTAIVLLTFGSRIKKQSVLNLRNAWLLALFVVAGGTGSTLKVFAELGPPGQREALLLVVFGFAGVLCLTSLWAGGQRPRISDMVGGGVLGLGNFVANTFLLKGLEVVSGVVAFPALNSGILFLAAFLGIAVWKERPTRLEGGALVVSGLAIVLLSI
jgi:drug/metabolite transporter (DMT)-like permease